MGYYWAVHQRQLSEQTEELAQARKQLSETEAKLQRAAPVAADLKRLSARAGRGSLRRGASGSLAL